MKPCHQPPLYFPCAYVLQHSFQEDLLLERYWHVTNWPIVAQIFLFSLFKNGGYIFPLFQSVVTSSDCHFSNMIDNGLAQLHLPVASGAADASHWVPWTLAPSGSLDVLKPDLLLQQAVLYSPSPCFCLSQLWWCGWNTCQWKPKQKSGWVHLSLLHVLGNHISHFLLERTHVFPLW